MKHLYSVLVLLACTCFASAQTGKLTGVVTESNGKTTLEAATVSLFNADSSLVGYKVTDRNGAFVFEKLPLRKKLLVTVTYVGYSVYRNTVELQGTAADTLNIALTLNTNDSNAVTVTAVTPVRMNGDTLEINPSAFKMGKNSVVEELLNQVPGIVIWSDGSITVNGKPVQNVLVDGKPFMGMNDPRIATQNLPKTAIDKIQLYQEYDRSKIGEEQRPQDSLLTMNIKLKENAKTGYFGKGGAGYGTSDRFESDLSFQAYNKKSSGGIGGGFNNINKSIGNLQELFRNNTFSNFNPNLNAVGRFGGGGINKNHSIGGVFTHSFIETTNSRENNRITLNYNKTGTDSYVTDLSLQNRTTLVNPQFIRDEGESRTQNSRHEMGLNYSKTNSYNDNLGLNGTASFNNDNGISKRSTEVRDGNGALQTTNTSYSSSKRRSDAQSVSFNFGKSDTERPLRNFNVRVVLNRNNSESERNTVSNFDSYTDNTKDTTYTRRYLSHTNVVSLNMSSDYGGFKRLITGRFNLYGINLRFSQSFNYNKATDNSAVSDYDRNLKDYVSNNKISNRNERELTEYMPTVSIGKSFNKWNEKRGKNVNIDFRLMNDFKKEKITSSIAQRNINRSFHFFRYGSNLNYWYQRQQKYQLNANFNYEKRYSYPLVDYLYTIVDDINAYDVRIGNPRLRNTIDHSLNLNTSFNTQNPKSQYSFNAGANGGYTRSLNPITDSIINEISGRRTSYYINADKRNNLYLGYYMNLSRKLKNNNIQLMYNGSFNGGKSPNYIDGVYTVSQTQSISNQFTLQFSLRTVLIASLSKSMQQYNTKQSAANLRSFSNKNDVTRFSLTLNYPKNVSFSTTFDQIDNSNLNKATMLWNAFLSYRCFDQQGELKFTAMDILKQYQNISNGANNYGTTTRITNGLQQYFLVTFSYFPRKFGKQEGKGTQDVRVFDVR